MHEFFEEGDISTNFVPRFKKLGLVDDGTCGGRDFHYVQLRPPPSNFQRKISPVSFTLAVGAHKKLKVKCFPSSGLWPQEWTEAPAADRGSRSGQRSRQGFPMASNVARSLKTTSLTTDGRLWTPRRLIETYVTLRGPSMH